MDFNDKSNRVLSIYTKLLNGGTVKKSEEAIKYGVNERTVQRDIDSIRNFLDEESVNGGIINSVVYDRTEKGYRLDRACKLRFTNPEILAICKILLDSRAFTKPEMENLLTKLIECCVSESERKLILELIKNEAFHYIEPQHKSVFIDKLSDNVSTLR